MRSVYGIDVTTRAVSLVRISENDPTPRVGVVNPADTEGAVHTVASEHHRHQSAASNVLAGVLKAGTPSLVVMTKCMWNDMKADPSAFRRAGLWWAIVNRLIDAGVPVAEFPLPSVLPWLNGEAGTSRAGKGMLPAIADIVRANWPDVNDPLGGFRMSTVAVAAAGAMAVGIPTPIPATQNRLNLLTGYPDPAARERTNKAIQFPHGVKPPRTVSAWLELSGERTPSAPAMS